MKFRKSSFSSDSWCVEAASVKFRKSSYSTVGNCVEVAATDDAILVRDSKNPHNGLLSFTHEEWAAFIAGTKSGEFDLETLAS